MLKPKLVFTIIVTSVMIVSLKVGMKASVFDNNQIDTSNQIAPIETNQQAKIIQPVYYNRKNEKIIYYNYAASSKYNKYWGTAVKRWNKLNVIKLVKANNSNQPSITFQNNVPISVLKSNYNHNMSSQVNGLAHTDYSLNNGVNYVYHSTGNLTNYCINTYYNDPKTLSNVATHELGHLLGLSHDDKEVHVKTQDRDFYAHLMMNPNNIDSAKPIGNYEKRTLQTLYN